MSLSRSVEPTVRPVTLEEVKAHCRIEHTRSDEYLDREIIPTAIELTEAMTGRALLAQTWILTLRRVPAPGCRIVLPHPPASSITSINYINLSGVSTLWATSEWVANIPTGPFARWAEIEAGYLKQWPAARDVYNALTVTWVAGYGTGRSSVPRALRTGVLAICEQLYRDRPADQVTVPHILDPFIAERFDLVTA